MKRTALILSVAFCLIFLSTAVFAGKPTDSKSFGQTVYVPAAYNDYPNNQRVITRIVIRNIDPAEKITVTSVAFYDPYGNFVKEFLGNPVVPVDIEYWSSKTYAANSVTLSGVTPYLYDEGRPCFIVKWEAEDKVIAPMINSGVAAWDTVTNRFMGLMTTSGKVIEEESR
jgi:hypothetical protein